MSKFIGWSLALEFEQREVEHEDCCRPHDGQSLFELVIYLFLGVPEMSQYLLANFTHFPQ